VLHTKANVCKPWTNETIYSRSKESLLSGIGSRYSPASPCSKLLKLRDYGESVFIGKPCDVSSLRNAQLIYNDLSSKVILAIGIFCADGTSETADISCGDAWYLRDEEKKVFR